MNAMRCNFVMEIAPFNYSTTMKNRARSCSNVPVLVCHWACTSMTKKIRELLVA